MRGFKKLLFIAAGILLLYSCGNGKMSEKQLKDLEGRAEKGDVEAVQQLVDYYGNMEMPLSIAEYSELSIKTDLTPEEAQKLQKFNEIKENYEKWDKVASELKGE